MSDLKCNESAEEPDAFTLRAHAEKLAAEKYPPLTSGYFSSGAPPLRRDGFIDGFLAAKTEPVTVSRRQFDIIINSLRIEEATIGELEAAFRAAGIRIEGDDDE